MAAKAGEEEAPEAEEIKTDEKMSVQDAISKVKSLLKVINLATKELDPADVANTFKMLKIATTKKLAKLNQENTPKK